MSRQPAIKKCSNVAFKGKATLYMEGEYVYILSDLSAESTKLFVQNHRWATAHPSPLVVSYVCNTYFFIFFFTGV